jgi:hypothetical protein
MYIYIYCYIHKILATSRLPPALPDYLRSSASGTGLLSLVSTTEELLGRNTILAAPVKKVENTAVGIYHADHVAHSIRRSWH